LAFFFFGIWLWEASFLRNATKAVNPKAIRFRSYRLVDKYMRQPCLRKLSINIIDKNYLSFGMLCIPWVVSWNRRIQVWITPFNSSWSMPLKISCRHSKNWSQSASWIWSTFSLTVGNK
jgi:hypothetical protein